MFKNLGYYSKDKTCRSNIELLPGFTKFLNVYVMFSLIIEQIILSRSGTESLYLLQLAFMYKPHEVSHGLNGLLIR